MTNQIRETARASHGWSARRLRPTYTRAEAQVSGVRRICITVICEISGVLKIHPCRTAVM